MSTSGHILRAAVAMSRDGKWLVNRYAVQPVDNDPPLSNGKVRTFIIWDRLRQRAIEEGTRGAMRLALRGLTQEKIEPKEGDIL